MTHLSGRVGARIKSARARLSKTGCMGGRREGTGQGLRVRQARG